MKTISRKAYEQAMTSGEAPDGCHFLAVATNMEDRPCGWGKAKALADAKAEADRQYAAHNCYPGEVRKPSYEVSIVDDAPVAQSQAHQVIDDLPGDPPCAAMENGMSLCTREQFDRGAACTVCAEHFTRLGYVPRTDANPRGLAGR